MNQTLAELGANFTYIFRSVYVEGHTAFLLCHPNCSEREGYIQVSVPLLLCCTSE